MVKADGRSGTCAGAKVRPSKYSTFRVWHARISTRAMDFDDESSVKVLTQEFTAVVLAGFGTA